MDFKQYQHIDPGQLLETVGNDWQAVASLAYTYLDTAPPILEQLERAIDDSDAAAVWRHSHTLKGMSALIGAAPLAAMLSVIELSCRDGNLPSVTERQALARQFELAAQELAHCLRTQS